ncbi:DUF411 domain-containing protein [Thalassobacter stenotrophicus]|jgi:hypothetical protein|uniref:Metal-binding protein n=2 Tax=Thalassobacter stenotrophicus TaxID=266809 RepID=A0A0P1FG85_9RHOB|nr:DUF411 domain-containing protein [Thalassobacter stenotrophicus]PVZ45912.1 DUF411 domain-containing protein [Thalassobacter stenotrophicus]UYP69658.1 DUF411 domain-containing protein [Thalassobacter stenotrophicus]CUH60843.1 Protein of unknown function, DUF [Thalassobacter stenotrophicus]SHJ13799.1 Uncharacterized conserved protein [Thalassobacter stenotrophicus DSM 16310]
MRQLSLAIAFFLGLATQAIAEATPIDVKKTNGCGCCLAWMEHLEENGFAPTGEDMFAGLLVRFKLDNGVPQRMESCHTGLIEGYVIEGHVPADDIRRLLSERPDAVGLAVQGMPLGSPGMDQSRWREAYDVFLIHNDGSTEIFSSYLGN